MQKLDKQQPLPGAQLIVLSEHVDYWNQLGWQDPWSSSFFSERQSGYADRLRSEVYTPQMIVDGRYEFVGSDDSSAARTVEKAIRQAKLSLRIASAVPEGDKLKVRLEAAALPAAEHASEAAIYLAIADNLETSQVVRGENEGHTLSHVAVVRSLTRVGTLNKGSVYAQDLQVPLPSGWRADNLRVIAFVQAPDTGWVLGVTMQHLVK